MQLRLPICNMISQILHQVGDSDSGKHKEIYSNAANIQIIADPNQNRNTNQTLTTSLVRVLYLGTSLAILPANMNLMNQSQMMTT